MAATKARARLNHRPPNPPTPQSATDEELPISTLNDCKVIALTKIEDERGNLTFIEENNHIGFGIKRVYYLYDVPGGAARGGHAHRGLHQLLVALAGSFDVIIDDGKERQTVHLNRPYTGLYLAPMIWREIDNFSSGSVCLVLASDLYNESDYIRDYESFSEVARP